MAGWSPRELSLSGGKLLNTEPTLRSILQFGKFLLTVNIDTNAWDSCTIRWDNLLLLYEFTNISSSFTGGTDNCQMFIEQNVQNQSWGFKTSKYLKVRRASPSVMPRCGCSNQTRILTRNNFLDIVECWRQISWIIWNVWIYECVSGCFPKILDSPMYVCTGKWQNGHQKGTSLVASLEAEWKLPSISLNSHGTQTF